MGMRVRKNLLGTLHRRGDAPGATRGLGLEPSCNLRQLRNCSAHADQQGTTHDSDSTGTTTRTLVSSFSRDSTGDLSIGTISVDIGATGSMLVDSSGGGAGILDKDRTVTSGGTYSVLDLDISALTDSAADLTDLEDYIAGVDTAITSMTDATNGSNLTALGIARGSEAKPASVSMTKSKIATLFFAVAECEKNFSSIRGSFCK